MTKYACLFLIALSVGLVGCSEKTQESVEEDTANATAASVMTPKIKAALIANPILNETDNLIDVETQAGTVYLRGHVKTQEAKDEATQIAQRVLDESESDMRLENELEVIPVPKDDGPDSDSTTGN